MTYRTSLPLYKTEDDKPKKKARKVAKATKKLDKAINSDKFLNPKNKKQEKVTRKKAEKAFKKYDKAMRGSAKKTKGETKINPNRVKYARKKGL